MRSRIFSFQKSLPASLQGLIVCKNSKKGDARCIQGSILFFVAVHDSFFSFFRPARGNARVTCLKNAHKAACRAPRSRRLGALGVNVRRSLCRPMPGYLRPPLLGAPCVGVRAGVRSYPVRGPAPVAKTVQQPRAPKRRSPPWRLRRPDHWER